MYAMTNGVGYLIKAILHMGVYGEGEVSKKF